MSKDLSKIAHATIFLGAANWQRLDARLLHRSDDRDAGPAVIIFRPPWALIESGSLKLTTNTLPETAALPNGF